MEDVLNIIKSLLFEYKEGIISPKKLFSAFFKEFLIGSVFFATVLIPAKISSLFGVVGIIIAVHALFCLFTYGFLNLFLYLCSRSHNKALLSISLYDEEVEDTKYYWIPIGFNFILGLSLSIISGNKTPRDGAFWEPIFITGIGFVLMSIICSIKRIHNRKND